MWKIKFDYFALRLLSRVPTGLCQEVDLMRLENSVKGETCCFDPNLDHLILSEPSCAHTLGITVFSWLSLKLTLVGLGKLGCIRSSLGSIVFVFC